jgi:shikimate dehydrogenase
VLDIAVDVRPVAGAVGAGNTLLPGPDGWIADNTDVHGLVAALREHAVRPRSASVLGAGGTAQAALAALAELGLPECTVLVRDPRRTAALLATADRVGIAVSLADLEAGTEALEADVVISTLPPGAADQVAGHPWSARQAVLDVVYADWPTALARAAAATGAISISGATVLLHQAARQVELMTGQPAPLAAMHAALPGGDL